MKKSIIAFVVTLVLGFLSMGGLGLGLYYFVWPVLMWLFPPQSAWHGDWVWPAMIVTGLAWGLGFLAAGDLNKRLAARGTPRWKRRAAYVAVLWLWDLLLWGLTLSAQDWS